MAWFDVLTGASIARWFEEASQGQYARERKLDVLATSMRDFDDVPPQLTAVRDGREIPGGDVTQRVADLRGARLLIDATHLTPLGSAVLRLWVQYGVTDPTTEFELARHLILVTEAFRQNDPHFRELATFWRELTSKFGAEALLDNWDKLFVLSYLDFERAGFRPTRILVAAPVPLDQIENNLVAVADQVAPGNARARQGADRIQRAIEGRIPRDRARATFCLAMELATAAAPDAERLLDRFGVPRVPRNWQALSTHAREICLKILRERGNVADLTALEPAAAPVLELLRRRKNVILHGPPGTGKTRAALATADIWRRDNGLQSVYEVTFHPSYGYEDFVWGYRPDPENAGVFSPQLGILLRACDAAASGTPTLLLIDEVNRADTAKVFGELITYLESDKRDRSFRIAQDPANEYSIPSNLFFLGTMNTADRSVSLLDVALRRRFAFLEFYPEPAALDGTTWRAEVGGVQLGPLLRRINDLLGQIGIESDRAIGHALLGVPVGVADPVAALLDRFEHDIYPLVVDYCFSDRTRVRRVLGPLTDEEGRFVKRTPADFIAALMELAGQQQAAVAPGAPANATVPGQ